MLKMTMNDDYSKNFSEDSFWDKLSRFAEAAGREVVEKALTVFYALKDKDTPAWAKGIITAALGYFILPADAIPDLAPFVGYADDLGAIGLAVAAVASHIKEEHRDKARELLKKWFPGEQVPTETQPPEKGSGE